MISLKFFLYNRLKYLAGEYGEKQQIFEPMINDGSVHRIVFLYEDGRREEKLVEDGTQLSSDFLPDLDHSKYDAWHIFEDGTLHRKISCYEPIYEDRILVLEDYDKTSY